MFFEDIRALKIEGNSAKYIDDPVALEGKVSIYVNNELISVQVASISELRELGAGYVISEGIAEEVQSAEADGSKIYVYADDAKTAEKEMCSAGGFGYSIRPKKVSSGIKINSQDIIRATEKIVTDVWKKTGGVHCSVLFRDQNIITRMSDVGRHNTLDKVIGFAALNKINRQECYIGCTGRQPFGMVKKCANAGIPVIISKAASTANGIKLAEESGITLICFARGERYTVYSHPWRVAGIKSPKNPL